MANYEIVGGIIEKTIKEIIAEKHLSGDEGKIILNKSLKIVALALAKAVSISNTEDLRNVKSIIEE